MRGHWSAAMALVLGLDLATARADELASPPTLTSETPPATLGRPMALGATLDRPSKLTAAADDQVRAAAYTSPGNTGVRSTSLDPVPTLPVAPLGAPAAPASPAEQYNCGVVAKSPGADQSYWDKCKGFFTGIPDALGGRALFQSDHGFDGFISPMTNPFYFEDPRSLTEVRPMFFFQGAPHGNPVFRGGDIEYAGLQARVAFTDCFSLVISKLGEVWIEPHNPNADFQNHAGFTDLVIGPKYTFLRSDSTGTLGAAGLNFDIPAGSRHVLENTGSLSLEPYVSLGQSFFPTSYGNFHALGTVGYNFSIDRQRSDNLFTSLHLDFDYGQLHKIYPFVEMNWFLYTSNGRARDLNFDGRDLFNFGSNHVSGHNEVTIAPGVRYKVNECLQLGLAAEFPLTGASRSVLDYRVLFDVIIRY